MARLVRIPRLTTISLALFLTAGAIIFSDIGCAPKPACGNRHDHKKRKRAVKRMAPSMGY